ncbi:hypothetical protein [Lysobacter enzymogenes]|uniref:hypothetical protein n=1 Tax=Lysobacter enzymogenes TaxID=69 RepID=UPI000944FBB3|nr:hypothetical protein [Lysobacter enzymogenes]
MNALRAASMLDHRGAPASPALASWRPRTVTRPRVADDASQRRAFRSAGAAPGRRPRAQRRIGERY